MTRKNRQSNGRAGAPTSARISGARGVTLLELLVAVAIVAILGTIAVPSYVKYITRANRSAAKSLLLQVADRQEQYFADHKAYATTLTALGYSANPFMINDRGDVVAATSGDRVYQISLVSPSASSFKIKADPQLVQATRDTECASLTLDRAGLKSQTGSGDRCW
jgi:type IV pilus assembly protein PilE